jgi:purine-binding chemotaxis protein CheW
MRRVLVFTADALRFGIPLERVREVVRAVAVDPLPGAPAVIAGAIIVRGGLVPVFDMRARFGLRPSPIRASEHFILARAERRTVAIRADAADWIEDVADDAVIEPAAIARGLARLEGVGRLPDGLVLLQDLDAFLDQAESDALAGALEAYAP